MNSRKADRLDTARGHYWRNLEALGIQGDEMAQMYALAKAEPNDTEMFLAAVVTGSVQS